MKTTIKLDILESGFRASDGNREWNELTFSDEGFETGGSVRISFGNAILGDVKIEELLPVLIGFDAKASRAMENNK